MNIAQRSFAAGELAPTFYARTDLAKYAVGLRTCRNFVVLRQGGASNRAGTEYVTPLNSSARILPFVFNDAQAYVLTFTDRALAIVRRGAVIGTTLPTPYVAADLATLQIAQSADVVTITHANYPTAELRRTADTAWSLTPIDFRPTIATPANVAVSPTVISLFSDFWAVTAISAATGEESFAGVTIPGGPQGGTSAKVITWDPVPGASAYRIYRAPGGTPSLAAYGLVGEVPAPATTFIDSGAVVDTYASPPVRRTLFAAAGDYPGVVARYQQRMVLGGSTNAPETVWTSRVGDEHNFTTSRPLQDDDAVTFTPASTRVNLLRHLVDVSPLVGLTSGGAFVVNGDGAGIIRPTDINVQQLKVPGAGTLPPIVVDARICYVHARQNTVRALELARNFAGVDLTLMAGHLFTGHTLVDWAYQETPDSVLWCVRSDGVLLGCTMLADEDVLAWHRHDTDGLVENVCAIPEGGEDVLYLVVNRNGRRALERMASRVVADMRDAIYLDASLVYDGRNTGAETMTLTGGPRWASDELLTVTRSVGGFSPAEIGNAIVVADVAGVEVRVALSEYVSATQMRGTPSVTVPASLRNVARATWSRAVDDVTGLDHLEGKAVAVLADGMVAANPLNQKRAALVVSGGRITLARPAAVIRVGLPYIADLETLDVDSTGGRATKDAKWIVNAATVHVVDSRGAWVGQSLPTGTDPLQGLAELLVRDRSDAYGPIVPRTGALGVAVPAQWQSSGRLAIRHVDPIPLTVSAVVPRGLFPPG